MSDKKELLNIQLASIDNECPYPDRKKGLFFIHDFEFNGNGLKIPEELASEYLDSLNGTPLVAYYDPITDDIEDHKETRDKKTKKIIALNTDAIGTLFNAHIGTHEIDEEERYGVWAEGFLWLRFRNTLNVIQRLFDENGKVDVSVEVAYSAAEFLDDGKRIAKDYLNYFGTALLGSKFDPAYTDAGMYALNNLEVASAFEQDINLSAKADEENINQEINGGVAMLSHEELKQKLSALLNPNDNKDGGWKTDYWTWDMVVFDTFCVARNADSGKLFRFDYEIQNEVDVVLTGEPREQMVQYVDVPEGETVEVSGVFNKIKEYEEKVKELNSSIEEKTTELNSLSEEKGKLEEKVTELSSVKTEVEQKDEAIISLNNQINDLTGKINELAPIKEAWEVEQENKRIAELNAQKEELKNIALNSEMINVEELESNEEIKQAIEELNSQKINDIIVKRIIDSKVKKDTETELNTKKDDVTLTIDTNGKDLIPETLESKYGLNL